MPLSIPALGRCLNWGMAPEAALKEHLREDDYVVMGKWPKRSRHKKG